MKRVFLDKAAKSLSESLIHEDTPVFAKQNGKLKGMVVKEGSGWILRKGGACGSSGWHDSRADCIEAGASCGFEFFVEE